MFRFTILILTYFILIGNVYSQKSFSLFERQPGLSKSNQDMIFSKEPAIDELRMLKPKRLEVSLPFNDRELSILLERVHIFPVEGIQITTSSGKEYFHKNSIHYVGFSEKHPNSKVYISIYENDIAINLSNLKGKSYSLKKNAEFNSYTFQDDDLNATKGVDDFSVCSNRNVEEPQYDGCGVPDYFRSSGSTDSKITIYWNDFNDAIRYQYQYRKNTGGAWISKFSNQAVALIDNLDASTGYEIRIRSRCSNGWSGFSQIFSFSTAQAFNPQNLNRSSGQNVSTQLGIYYELDHQTFITYGNVVANSVQAIVNLHMMVNTLYNNIGTATSDDLAISGADNSGQTILNGFNLNILITGIHVWDGMDPYPIPSNQGGLTSILDDRLAAFINQVNQRPIGSVNGDLFQLVNDFVVSGGLAAQQSNAGDFPTGLCETPIVPLDANWIPDQATGTILAPVGPDAPFSVSFLGGVTGLGINGQTPEFKFNLMAHEIGHNLGAKHTSGCNWYQTTGPFHPIETTCNNPECVQSPTSTNTVSSPPYQTTLMSGGCWSSVGFPNPNVPFHLLNAEQVCMNVAGLLNNSCLQGVTPCSPDLDGDGFCSPEDCNDNDPNVPGYPGENCNDGDPVTFNDVYNNDPCPICEGQLWMNSVDDNCNLITGGDIDFEDISIGRAQGTSLRGVLSDWIGGNSPDIGGELENGNCDHFIQMIGRLNATTVEGFGIPLAAPIPANTGVAELTFNYAIFDDDLARNGEIFIQGSQNIFPGQLPLTSDPPIPEIINLGEFDINANYSVAWNNNEQDFGLVNLFPSQCDNIDVIEFSPINTFNISNTSNVDLNFIYISYDVADYNGTNPFDVSQLLLDNVRIEINPVSYCTPEVTLNSDGCIIESVTHQQGCEYFVQNLNPITGDWDVVSHNQNSNMFASNILSCNSQNIIEEMINLDITKCGDYRLVQVCPPFVCQPSESCFNFGDNCIFEIVSIPNNCNDLLFSTTINASPSSLVCNVNQVTLTATIPNPTSSVLWSNGATSPSIVVNTEDTYSVTVTDNTSNCEATASLFVDFEDCIADSPIPSGAGCTFTQNLIGTDCPNISGQDVTWFDSGMNPIGTGLSFSNFPSDGNYFYEVNIGGNCGTITSPSFDVSCTCPSLTPLIVALPPGPDFCNETTILSIDGMAMMPHTVNWTHTSPSGVTTPIIPSLITQEVSESGTYNADITLVPNTNCTYSATPIDLTFEICELYTPLLESCTLTPDFDCELGQFNDWRAIDPADPTGTPLIVSTIENFTPTENWTHFYTVNGNAPCDPFYSSPLINVTCVQSMQLCNDPEIAQFMDCGLTPDRVIALDGNKNLKDLITIPQNGFNGLVIQITTDPDAMQVTLTIDDAIFENCTFYVPQNLIIEVVGNVKINESRFFPCNSECSWWGLASDGELELTASTIVGASFGTAIRNNTTSVISVDYIACLFGMSFQTKTGQIEVGMRGNTFTNCGVGMRINKGWLHYPTDDSGMLIKEDNLMDSEILSTFQDCDVAVFLEQGLSNLTNLSIQGETKKGISLENGASAWIEFIEINGADQAIISKDQMAVFFAIGNSNISNSGSAGILFPNRPIFFKVADNNFSNVESPITIENASSDQIEHDPLRQGILRNVFSNCSGDMISLNNVRGEKIQTNSVSGMSDDGTFLTLSGCQNTEVRLNNPVNITGDQVGIFSSGGKTNSYNSNSIFGPMGSPSGLGINVQDQAPFLCNNSINEVSEGLLLNGAGQMQGTWVLQNKFLNNVNGLTVELEVIGEQDHRENIWENTNGQQSAASIEFGLELGSVFNYNPNFQNLVPANQIGDGWFFDDFSGPIPLPGLRCGENDPNNLVGDDDTDCFSSLKSFGPECCDLVRGIDCDVILKLFGPSTGISSLTTSQLWSLQQDILEWWNSLNGICPVGPPPPDILDCINIFDPPPGDGDEDRGSSSYYTALIAQSNVRNTLKQANILNPALAQIVNLNTAEMIQIVENVSNYNPELLFSLDSINNKIVEDHIAQRESLYPSLIIELNSLPEPYEFVEMQNKLLRAEIELLQTDLDSLDGEFWNDIITVAFSCPSYVGDDVYRARAYYYQVGGPHPKDYDDLALCNTIDQRSTKPNDDVYFQAYPNPFSDEISIVNMYRESIKSIYVHDFMQNQILFLNGKESDGTYKLKMSNISKGIYIISIIYDDDTKAAQKVIKVH